LKHSFSQKFFTEKFLKENIRNCSYNLYELNEITEIEQLLTTPNLKGLNVTIPYKIQALEFTDWQSEAVKKIGATNCIKISNNRIEAHNTDAIGFKKSLLNTINNTNYKALVLGTGGAAQAVYFVLNELNIPFKKVSRNQTENGFNYSQITEAEIAAYNLIINTTPLGTYPNIDEKPNLPYERLTHQHVLFDLVYNPATTAFLQEGLVRGCMTKNGYDMLVHQAEAAWEIWNT
jgi:shikimate dehydrogenase